MIGRLAGRLIRWNGQDIRTHGQELAKAGCGGNEGQYVRSPLVQLLDQEWAEDNSSPNWGIYNLVASVVKAIYE